MFEPIARFGTVDVAKPLDSEMIRLLKEECDDVTTFTEGGQFYVAGWKNTRRVVYAHCDPKRYRAIMHPSDDEVDLQYRRPGRSW